eukprot:CAMPEP_0114247928 /NCGR_PEP_ID=MMETSP0058-20121206/13288_1 /TAXON_ID=36894 /ORGANISM="Pyramimonas parkeae, CCMP726" /LENGTH=137 /DNA_ID=CAMNT_0001361275 /DNA_START=557 /DNA_END=970 /DNA_ORIENTATION=+
MEKIDCPRGSRSLRGGRAAFLVPASSGLRFRPPSRSRVHLTRSTIERNGLLTPAAASPLEMAMYLWTLCSLPVSGCVTNICSSAVCSADVQSSESPTSQIWITFGDASNFDFFDFAPPAEDALDLEAIRRQEPAFGS